MKLHHNKTFILPLCGLLALFVACGQNQEELKQANETEEHKDELNFQTGAQLTAEQRLLANIQTVPAVSKALVTSMTLSAVAEQDLDNQTHVNSPLPGVVIEIQAALGDEVEIGDPLCTIRSAPLAQAVADMRSAQVELESFLQLQKQELVLLQRGVNIAEDAVEREEKLSREGFGTSRQLADAKAALQVEELRRDRRALELEQLIAKSEISLEAIGTKIESWGLEKSISTTISGAMGIFSLSAQSKGVVLERHITPGEAVDSQTQLFLIQGMEEVWMLASVFENQLRYLNEGTPAKVRFNAFPSMLIEGIVDHIHHDLDHDTRSVKARIKVRNRPFEGRTEPHPLLPGMFGSVEIETNRRFVDVAIPASSILTEGEEEYVFTMTKQGIVRQRFIETGLRSKDEVEVLKGLSAGDNVVIEGMFTLKSMSHMDSIGGHDH
ncbi:MAG: efflux RND transporter periplasmic adaptor subunit [Planctomycetota bacterium]